MPNQLFKRTLNFKTRVQDRDETKVKELLLNNPHYANQFDKQTLITHLSNHCTPKEIVEILQARPELTVKFNNEDASCSENDLKFAQLILDHAPIEKFKEKFREYLEACKLEIELFKANRKPGMRNAF